jgi:hypothetical protein
VSVVSHILSPVRRAIPVPCVVSPHLPLSRVHGPRSSFPVPTSLVPPSFPLFGPCRLSCPCAWCALSPSLSPSWSWSLHPPIHPASSCSQRRWGVLGCGSGCNPRASLPHASGPIVPSLSLVLPVSTPQAVAHGSGSGCCCAGRCGRHSATGRGQRRRGGVTGAYLVGIPLQGSPSTLRTPFIVRTSSLFVRHRHSVLRSLSYILRTLLYVVRTLLYVVRTLLYVVRMLLYTVHLHLYVIVVRMLSSFGPLYVVVCCSLSFVCCRTLFVHRHTLFVFIRMSLFIHRRTSFVVLHPSYIIPVAMYLEIYLKTVYW